MASLWHSVPMTFDSWLFPCKQSDSGFYLTIIEYSKLVIPIHMTNLT